MTVAETTQGLLSEKINERMEAKGITIRDLAQKLGMTYEHARRLSKGEANPSRLVLKALCEELELDFNEMHHLLVAVTLRKKYGTIPMELSGKNPEIEPIEMAWQYLTEAQKKDAVTMIQGWANRNKALKIA